MASELNELYGGEVLLRFNADRHTYHVTDPAKGLKNEKLRSSTSFSKNGPWSVNPLIGWAVKVTAAEILDRTTEYVKALNGKPFDLLEFNAIVREGKKARYRVLDKAGDIGTLVHDWIENYIKYEMTK